MKKKKKNKVYLPEKKEVNSVKIWCTEETRKIFQDALNKEIVDFKEKHSKNDQAVQNKQ